MKGICDYCQAGEEKPVKLTLVVIPGGTELGMCEVCRGLCLSSYPNQNLAPVTRVDLSRAVQYLIKRTHGFEP